MTKSEGSVNMKLRSWLDDETLLIREEQEPKTVYDLEERTARFGEDVIDFAKTIPQGPTTDRIISQLIGAATSVGANYLEADDSVSKKEFLKCIGTCKKEARETKHFLRMTVRAVSELKAEARKLWLESERIAPHFCQDLAKRKTTGIKEMTEHERTERSAIRPSSLVIPSSFVIRHSSLAPLVIRA